jgi:hypothetical protein
MSNVGGTLNTKVYVCCNAADLMNERAWHIDDLLSHIAICHLLHLRSQQRQAVLGVPREVKIDLAVAISAH